MNTKFSNNKTKSLQDQHLENLAKMLTDTLVKPTIGKDVRLKDLEPLPYIVWKDGELVELTKILPVRRS